MLVLLVVPGACLCAGLCYTFSKVIGWLPTVSLLALVIFDITCLLYLAIGMYFIKTGIENGFVLEGRLKAGKIFLVVIMFIQFNFIVYMIPATDFWGFAFFFVILTSFFLDYKMVAVTSVGIALSIVLSWILYGSVHLPAHDDTFQVNLLDRAVCVVLSLASIVLLTYLINKFLVNAKKDEMQRNIDQVQSVLTSVQTLSDNLREAGTALSDISENEGSSAQELAATSEQLASGSNMLLTQVDEGMANLNELGEWAGTVSQNVERVEEVSKNLLDQAAENQQILDSLKAINNSVADSMKITTDTATELSESVREIDSTLSLISEISDSTNLLALNASIEAARAGEAGRGFAVVASEVGALANNTRETLKDVAAVVERVQQSVANITAQVNDNASKITEQDEYVANVFVSMQSMTELLHASIDAITNMSDAHENQARVITKTISVNQGIADAVKKENEQFLTISEMAESNAQETSQIAIQAGTVNEMVEKIQQMLT